MINNYLPINPHNESMVAFARVRTTTWLSRLCPQIIQSNQSHKVPSGESEGFLTEVEEQNKRFLEVSKNGGIWFS